MTERVLTILRRHSKRVCCIFDGKMFETLSSENIHQLLQQVEEIGSVRVAKVIFDKQLSPKEHDLFINKGIAPIIVPSDKDVYMALEALDALNFQNAQVLALGVTDDQLLPIAISAREKIEVLVIGDSSSVQSYITYSDFLISVNELE